MHSENEQEFFTLTSYSKHLTQQCRSPKLLYKHLNRGTCVYLFVQKTTVSIIYDIFEFGHIVEARDKAEVNYFQEISRGANWAVERTRSLSQPALFRATHIFQMKTATAFSN